MMIITSRAFQQISEHFFGDIMIFYMQQMTRILQQIRVDPSRPVNDIFISTIFGVHSNNLIVSQTQYRVEFGYTFGRNELLTCSIHHRHRNVGILDHTPETIFKTQTKLIKDYRTEEQHFVGILKLQGRRELFMKFAGVQQSIPKRVVEHEQFPGFVNMFRVLFLPEWLWSIHANRTNFEVFWLLYKKTKQ